MGHVGGNEYASLYTWINHCSSHILLLNIVHCVHICVMEERCIASMPLHYRQGDLLFLWQDTRPAAKLNVLQSNVIVAGEATGHAHRLLAGTVLEAPDGTRYLDISRTTQVVHQEHGPITLEPG